MRSLVLRHLLASIDHDGHAYGSNHPRYLLSQTGVALGLEAVAEFGREGTLPQNGR